MIRPSIEEKKIRLDKWLWAARFFKTRNQAKQAIEGGKVHINESKTKVSRHVEIGDTIDISKDKQLFIIKVLAITGYRNKAEIARSLYRETTESINERERQFAQRRMERAGLKIPHLRPTKKGRRELRRLKQNAHNSVSDPYE